MKAIILMDNNTPFSTTNLDNGHLPRTVQCFDPTTSTGPIQRRNKDNLEEIQNYWKTIPQWSVQYPELSIISYYVHITVRTVSKHEMQYCAVVRSKDSTLIRWKIVSQSTKFYFFFVKWKLYPERLTKWLRLVNWLCNTMNGTIRWEKRSYHRQSLYAILLHFKYSILNSTVR